MWNRSPVDEFSRGRGWMGHSKFGRGPPGIFWRAVSDTAHVYRNTSRACGRVVALAAQNLLHRGNITMLGMALTGVFGCGLYEGLLLTHPTAPQPEAWRFAMHYALENMLPSVTWSTRPAYMVAAAYGTPLEVLCVHTLDDAAATAIASPEEAARALAAQGAI